MKSNSIKGPSLRLVLAGAWILTMAAGFFAGRRSAPEPIASTASSTEDAYHGGAISSTARNDSTRPVRASTRVPGHAADGTALERLNQLLAEPDRNARTGRFLNYIARLSSDDFPLVAAELANGPMNQIRRSEYAMLISEWATRDPYAAADYFKDNAQNDWERETVLSEWAVHAPQAAFDWAASTADQGKVNNWIIGAIKGIAASNPNLASRLLDAMEPSATRDRSMHSAAASIATLGADSVSGWLSSISDDKLRQTATWMIADPLARADAPSAGNWVATIPDPDARRNAAKIIAQRWASTDLNAARNWMETLPTDTQPKAAEGIASEYGRIDPQAGADWLASLGNGPELDPARLRFLNASYRQEPETAANITASITNPRLRAEYFNRVLNRWAASDRSAARAWVAANPDVPPSIQKRLLR